MLLKNPMSFSFSAFNSEIVLLIVLFLILCSVLINESKTLILEHAAVELLGYKVNGFSLKRKWKTSWKTHK